MNNIEKVLHALTERDCKPHAIGDRWMSRCPSHGDTAASLSIAIGDNGSVLMKCFSVCTIESIVESLGLKMTDLYNDAHYKPVIVNKKKQSSADGAALWNALSSSDQKGEEYLRSRGLGDAIPLVKFNTGSLRKYSENGYRVAVPMLDCNGIVQDFQLRAISDIRPNKMSLWGARPKDIAFGRPDLAKKGGRIFVTEGMADTLALQIAGFVVIGAAGVDRIKDLKTLIPSGSEVVLCVQNDERQQSMKKFQAFAKSLDSVEVNWLETPAPHKDPAEWLQSVGLESFKAAVVPTKIASVTSITKHVRREAERRQIASREPGSDDGDDDGHGRPTFQITAGNGHEAIDFANLMIARDPEIFYRGNELVTIVRKEDGRPSIAGVSSPMIWKRLSALVEWQKYSTTAEDWISCDPHSSVVEGVRCHQSWPAVRELRGVVGAPSFRTDGTLIVSPGYDRESGLFYFPDGACGSMPDEPTIDDARAGVKSLLEVVELFPWQTEAHKYAWLAALLTTVAKTALGESNVPLFLIDANSKGTGKSRLVDAISVIATGHIAAREGYTTNDEELAKAVTADLQSGTRIVLWDNVDTEFGGSTVDRLLTSEGWFCSRMLGRNTADARLVMRNCATWFVTANNATIKADVVRRAVHIRLETKLENPESRDFDRDFLPWIKEERPRLMAAALTVVRAWFVAGKPSAKLKTFGSFEAWSNLIRQIHRWLELPDPWSETLDGLRSADQGEQLHLALISGLLELGAAKQGMTTSEIKRILDTDIADASEHNRSPRYAQLLDALAAAAILDKNGLINPRILGQRLRHFKEKRCGNKYIVTTDSRGGACWMILVD